MSYRELRNFAEMMRSLGYPRRISLENFRQPNFELVADILTWMVKRYDPTLSIEEDLSTEQSRVHFITTACKIMTTRAHVKMAPKKLYMADGNAVKELLKVTTVLYQASKAVEKGAEIGTPSSVESVNYAQQIADVKTARALASEITTRGATLFDLLEAEVELRESRQKALGRQMDMDHVEKALKQHIRAASEEISSIRNNMSNMNSDEGTLEQKITKKKEELDVLQKRYKKIQNVRPKFMDEYEKLERSLSKLYGVYLERFRNLEYLEHELEIHHQAEVERKEAQDKELKKLQVEAEPVGDPFVVTCVHTFWDPAYTEEVKAVQMDYVLQRTAQFAGSNDVPVVICGDFNSIAGDAVYFRVVTGLQVAYDSFRDKSIAVRHHDDFNMNVAYESVDNAAALTDTALATPNAVHVEANTAEATAALEEKVVYVYGRRALQNGAVKDPLPGSLPARDYLPHLKSAYCSYQLWHPQEVPPDSDDSYFRGGTCMVHHEPPFTNFAENFKGCIDYIFHTPHLRVKRLLKVPFLAELYKETALPNSVYPSDHLPIMAELVID